MATVFEPIRPVPPMTTIFMVHLRCSMTGDPNGFNASGKYQCLLGGRGTGPQSGLITFFYSRPVVTRINAESAPLVKPLPDLARCDWPITRLRPPAPVLRGVHVGYAMATGEGVFMQLVALVPLCFMTGMAMAGVR